jgi:hypothetical protein
MNRGKNQGICQGIVATTTYFGASRDNDSQFQLDHPNGWDVSLKPDLMHCIIALILARQVCPVNAPDHAPDSNRTSAGATGNAAGHAAVDHEAVPGTGARVRAAVPGHRNATIGSRVPGVAVTGKDSRRQFMKLLMKRTTATDFCLHSTYLDWRRGGSFNLSIWRC